MRFLGRFRLVGRKERRVLDLISDHFDIVVRTVEQLQSVVDSAKAGDWKNVEEKTDKVGELETLADGLHRDGVVALSQGAFFSGTREDFLELMEKNDEVADAAQNASRILSETAIDQQSFMVLYSKPGATIDDLFARLLTAVQLVKESISALETDAEVAVSKSFLVERAEEEADEIKNRLMKHIFAHKDEMQVLTLLQLRDFVLKLDDVADAAEDSSDLVISLVAKAEA
jgi:predicted phosphate transport protein (TIGR00153 family)